MSTTWADIRAGWDAAWKHMEARALASYGSAIERNPGAFVPVVAGFVDELNRSRESLDRIRAVLPNPPATEADREKIARYEALERRYHDLAAGLYADAQTVPQVGTPLLVGIAVGGVLLGIGGIAWAVVAYEFAVNLREQTALAEKDLLARVEASKEGRVLPPSTLPPPGNGGMNPGWWVLGGLALAGGAFVLAKRGL